MSQIGKYSSYFPQVYLFLDPSLSQFPQVFLQVLNFLRSKPPPPFLLDHKKLELKVLTDGPNGRVPKKGGYPDLRGL